MQDQRQRQGRQAGQVERSEDAHQRLPPAAARERSAAHGTLPPGDLPPAAHPRVDQVKQGHLQRLVGGQLVQVDAQLAARGRQGGAVLAKPLAVALADELRIDVQLAAAFQVVEHGRFVEREVDLDRIEHADDHDLVPAGPQVAELRFQFADRREQVGEQHDEAALAGRLGDLLQRRGQVGARAGGGLLQAEHQPVQVARGGSGPADSP